MLRTLTAAGLVLCAGAAPALDATLAALPAETLFAWDVPDPVALDAALRSTAFGKLMLDPARYTAAWEKLKVEGPVEFRQCLETLQQRNLGVADLGALCGGSMGLAVLADPPAQPGQTPGFLLLAWLHPEGDLGQRLLDAIDSTEVEGLTLQRFDEELSGKPVRHYTLLDERGEGLHLLGCQDGTRLLLGVVISEDGAPLPPSAMTHFAQALDATPAADGFVNRLQQAPGHAQTLPFDEGMVHMRVDLVSVLDLIGRSMSQDESMPFTMDSLLQAGGTAACSAAGLSWSLGQGRATTCGHLSLPAPRKNLAGLLDQTNLSIQAPPWAAADLVELSVLPLNMQGLYDCVRAMAVTLGGADAERGFTMADQYTQGVFQVGVRDLLGMFGQRLHVVRLASPTGQLQGLDAEARLAEMQERERIAFLFEVADPALAQRVFDMMGNFAVGSGQAQRTDELGFACLRANFNGTMEVEAPPMSLLLGQGQLVFTMGDGTDLSVMSDLRTPPEGERALANAPAFTAAFAEIAAEQVVMWGYQDADQLVSIAADQIRQQLDTLEMMATTLGDELDPSLLLVKELFQSVLPSAEELTGLLGSSASVISSDQDGFRLKGVVVMPPAAE